VAVLRLSLGALMTSGMILMRPSFTSAQETAAAVSAGNLRADFYIQSSCDKPKNVTLPKPLATDRENVLAYNTAIRRHNEQLKTFGACIDAYTAKARKDMEWILFTVNTAIAKANAATPPSAPTESGNMPSGFYPSPDCVGPKLLGPVPDGHDIKAMDAYNTEVSRFNGAAAVFTECIKRYAARAQVDIERVEKAQGDAALQ
jgi:hypothetical protein